MDTVINRLSEIEEAAGAIADEANVRKKAFAKEMEDKTASFDTDLENFTLDGLFQLKHPAGRFAAIYRSGAIDMKDLPVPADAAVLMKHILSYAAAYELRNNLYDYHLDEDKTITLTNWKENLKWHYVQYTNVYNLALSSFVAACYSRKLLQKQFEENLRELNY